VLTTHTECFSPEPDSLRDEDHNSIQPVSGNVADFQIWYPSDSQDMRTDMYSRIFSREDDEWEFVDV
jgi:hypothetical protein